MITIKTGHDIWDNYWTPVENILKNNRLEIQTDHGFVSGLPAPDDPSLWYRDNIHMMIASVYAFHDVRSAIDSMLNTQNPDGSYNDFIALDGSMLRVPTEADLEYLAVIGVYRAWVSSGDDAWMKSCLPKLKRGLDYMTSHEWRWDSKHKMPKRAYTIDTWDFDARDDLDGIHWPGKIDDKTHFGIMHGDVSGLCYAWFLIAMMHYYMGKESEAKKYETLSKDMNKRAHELLWNGRFYRHRHPLDDFRIDGVNEEEQFSLSNAYNLNRRFVPKDNAKLIIEKYIALKKEGRAFAEWYSIDPPFPVGPFGTDKLKPGNYVNGGIMPHVGGELARGAFRYGYPEYGVDILRRYWEMIKDTGTAYLWYKPDGSSPTMEDSTSPEVAPKDCWGMSCMMGALIQGLVGVREARPGFVAAWLEPNWKAAGVDHAKVTLQYAASKKPLHYEYEFEPSTKTTTLRIEGDQLEYLHLGLPPGTETIEAESKGKKIESKIERWELGIHTAFCDQKYDEIRVMYK